MAIQNRRGVYSDFTPSKMVPGELAVVQSGDPNNTSGKAVYAAFGASGDVKRLATEDDLGSIDTELSDKVDKVSGKGLSTNDYTNTEKTKLAGIASGAEVNVQSDWNQSNTSADDFIKNKPTKTSDFTNDGDGTSNFATESYVQLNGGKIDTISVNGTQQTITNKNVDIPVPVIDNTLTQTGKAADAKVVGDELTDIKNDLRYYTEEDIPVNASPEGWRLTGTGVCTQASTYKLVKYLVAAGDMLHLTLSKDVMTSEAEGVYQWQNAANVPSQAPNTGLIGTPVTEAVDRYVEVPTGATYLIVSQFMTNTTNKVMLVTDVETVKEKIEGLSGDVQTELADKASAITNTASGSIAHFEDGSDANAKSMIAHIEPLQDLHGYDNPWPAGGGKNKLENASDSYSIANAEYHTYTVESLSSYSGVEMTFSIVTSDIKGKRIALYKNGDLIKVGNFGDKYVTATMPTLADTDTLRLYLQDYTADAVSITGAQLELGSTPTSYAPYSNICPISGFTGMNVVRTGKNLIPYPYSDKRTGDKGITFTVNEDGSVTIRGTATDTAYFNVLISKDAILLQEGTYVKSLLNATSGLQFNFNKKDGTALSLGSATTFTLTEPTEVYCFIRIGSGFTTEGITLYPQLELGSTATDYELYQGQTLPITFPSEAGTVYGGYVDVTQGKLVVDRAKVEIGSMQWSYNSTYARFESDSISETVKRPPTTIVLKGLISSSYVARKPQNTGSTPINGSIAINANGNCLLRDEAYSNVTSFIAAMGNETIVYPLATSITYNLTPQQIKLLTGVNNVWNDCNGNTDVEYNADTKLYIEQLTKPTEDDMTANANIANGTFFMVGGNRLFLSTASIAVGETIVPGTNCTELSLAEALNNLSA